MTATVIHPADLDRDWRQLGNCANLDDPDRMHPHDGDLAAIAEARRVCDGCPVAGTCLDDAIRVGDHEGIYAGYTGPERRQIAKRRRTGDPDPKPKPKPATAACPDCGRRVRVITTPLSHARYLADHYPDPTRRRREHCRGSKGLTA